MGAGGCAQSVAPCVLRAMSRSWLVSRFRLRPGQRHIGARSCETIGKNNVFTRVPPVHELLQLMKLISKQHNMKQLLHLKGYKVVNFLSV